MEYTECIFDIEGYWFVEDEVNHDNWFILFIKEDKNDRIDITKI